MYQAIMGTSTARVRLRLTSKKLSFRISQATWRNSSTASSSGGSCAMTGPKMAGPAPPSSTMVGTPNAAARARLDGAGLAVRGQVHDLQRKDPPVELDLPQLFEPHCPP